MEPVILYVIRGFCFSYKFVNKKYTKCPLSFCIITFRSRVELKMATTTKNSNSNLDFGQEHELFSMQLPSLPNSSQFKYRFFGGWRKLYQPIEGKTIFKMGH